MTGNLRLIALALAAALGGCDAAMTSEWTSAEAPKSLVLEKAASRIDLRFANGSSQLLPADAARLRTLAARGDIAPSDGIRVAAGGGPALAEARVAAIAAVLLPYGILVYPQPIAGLATGNRAILDTGRYLVTTPPCPNWSRSPVMDLNNQHASNFGCSTAVDLAGVVATPADLVQGRRGGPGDAMPAVAAVQRYQQDRVTLPTSVNISAIGSTPTTPAVGTGAATP